MTDKAKKTIRYIGTGLVIVGVICLAAIGTTAESVNHTVAGVFAAVAAVGAIIPLLTGGDR